jgi:hypothetical protein
MKLFFKMAETIGRSRPDDGATLHLGRGEWKTLNLSAPDRHQTYFFTSSKFMFFDADQIRQGINQSSRKQR